jgi:hypothetical protein
MNRALRFILATAIIAGFAANSPASPKKRDPDKREVAGILKKIGDKHFFEDMKVRDIGMILTGEEENTDKAYFWVFSTPLPEDAGYRLILFDNVPAYLGYYDVLMSPMECNEKFIVLNSGDFDQGPDPVTGETDRWSVEIPASGPRKRITAPGPKGPAEFVPAPTIEEVKEQKKEERQAAAEESSSSSSSQKLEPEYRSWNIKIGEKMIRVESAIFIEYKGGQVTIKDAKTGRTVTKPIRDFSEEDQKYLKQIIR